MSEMVERVAAALLAQAFQIEGKFISWEDRARAAIEAMREPTSMMIGAAMIQPHPSVSESGGIIQQGEAAVRIDWQAMIDEALR